jgi:peptide methionine sulfoxide reductase MsrA
MTNWASDLDEETPRSPLTESERTGHAEAVLVVFDPAVVSHEQLLRVGVLRA